MSKKQKILLILILAFAFLFRLTGVNHGLPQDFFGDELVHINAAFNLLEQRTLRANFDFAYVPPLLSYILAPIFGFCGVIGILIGKFQNILDYKNFVLLNWGYFLIFSRIIAAIFGTATIYFLFLLAKKLFNSKIALAASIFLTFDYLHFHESSHGQFWALATFFIVAGAYFIYQLYQSGEKKYYFWSALMIGLGFGAGYVPLILFPWFLAAHFLNTKADKKFQKKLLDKKIIVSTLLIVVLVGFFIFVNPYYSFYRQFGRTISTILDFFGYKTGFSIVNPTLYQTNFLGNLKEVITWLWYNNFLLFISGILGIFVLLWQKKFDFKNCLIIGLPLVYLFGLAFAFGSLRARYILPAIPFFVIISIYFFYYLADKIFRPAKYKNLIFILFVVLMISYSAYMSIFYAQKLLRPNTRIQAIDWIYQNIPTGSRIILDVPRVWLNESKEGIEFLKENNPQWFNARKKYLLTINEDQYPKPNYFIYNLSYLNLEKLNFEKIKADYYIHVILDDPKRELIYSSLLNKELIAKFYPREKFDDAIRDPADGSMSKLFTTLRSIDYLGPYVEIYKLK